jgi:ketol-acid reductoisomerase
MARFFQVVYNLVEENCFFDENTETYETCFEAEAVDLFGELIHKAGMEVAIMEFEGDEMISYDYHGDRAYDLWVAEYES